MFSSFSNPTPPHPLPFPADPLCRPANGGSACEDEGEESADRRAGRARNTSQRKSLTPWAEAGKTVILPLLTPPHIHTHIHTHPPPRFVLCGSRAELGEAAEPTFVSRTAAGVCERALDICVGARCLSDRSVNTRLIYTHTFSAQTRGDEANAYTNF